VEIHLSQSKQDRGIGIPRAALVVSDKIALDYVLRHIHECCTGTHRIDPLTTAQLKSEELV